MHDARNRLPTALGNRASIETGGVLGIVQLPFAILAPAGSDRLASKSRPLLRRQLGHAVATAAGAVKGKID